MRIGFIGLKGHLSVVLEGAQQLGGCQVVAVSDNDERAVARFLEREQLAREAQGYRDWRHLVEHAMMDVCCVCDENGLRAEQLVALAERNVHIVTEKPLTTKLEDLARVRSALAQSKSRLTMLLTMRHDAKYATMRRLVQQGVIGPVALATAQKSYRLGDRPQWQKSRARLGGTIPFIGIHPVDLIHWITGLQYTHVAALHGNLGKPQMRETETQASLLLGLENGGSVTVRLDYLRPETAPTHGDDRLRFAGPEGVLEARGDEQELLLVTSKRQPHRVPPERVENLFVAFVEALRRGGELPIPEQDSFYATEVVLAARDAADTGRIVQLDRQRARNQR